MSSSGVHVVPARWQNTVLVCRKCGKRAGGGFGPEGTTSLAKALRKYLGLKKGRKAAAGVVEVGCLGVCPKGAVTVVNGNTPGAWLVVPPATPLAEVAARLNLTPPPAAPPSDG